MRRSTWPVLGFLVAIAGNAEGKTLSSWDGVWTGWWGGQAHTKVVISKGRVVEYDYRDAVQPGRFKTTISGDTLTFTTPPNFVITLTKSGEGMANAHYHNPPRTDSDAVLTRQ